MSDNSGNGWGWAMFSGLALLMIGAGDVLRGLNFTAYGDKLTNVVGIDNPDAWASIFIVVGVLVIAAGCGTFSRAGWAQKVGIAGVLLAAVGNAFFMLSPIQSAAAIGFALDMFVLYALTVKWE